MPHPPDRVTKAVIPAAGLGTRFLPATKAQPKEMLPVVDRPAIHYIVQEAVESGITDLLIITGRDKTAIEDYFDRSLELEQLLEHRQRDDLLRLVRDISNLAHIHYIRQQEPLGLGHAVLCARHHVGDRPFAVLLADDIVISPVPALRQLLDCYEQLGHSVIAVQRVAPAQVTHYGIISPQPRRDGLYRVLDLVEKPAPHLAPSDLAVTGRYVLDPHIFSFLDAVTPGVGGEIQLTDALRLLCREYPLYACEFEGRRFDVGDKMGFLAANVELALARRDIGPAFQRYLASLLKSLEREGTRELSN